MKVKYIKCMDFTFEEVEVPDYTDILELNKAITNGKMIKVLSLDKVEDILTNSL